MSSQLGLYLIIKSATQVHIQQYICDSDVDTMQADMAHIVHARCVPAQTGHYADIESLWTHAVVPA